MLRFPTYLFIYLFVSSFLSQGVWSKDGNLPPRITRQPTTEIAYRDMETVELPCEAIATPPPKFYWKKNDVQLKNDDERVRMNSENIGTLSIVMPTPDDDGIYQCFAFNRFGAAVSVKTILRRAFLQPFPSKSPTVHHPVLGDPLTLQCTPPPSYPMGISYWGENKPGAKLQPVDNTERISQDYEGSLHFSNILAEDAKRGERYVCIVAEDVILRSLVQGDDQVILPHAAEGSPKRSAPLIMWASPRNEIAIKGQEKKMKCIFSGYPTPVVSWTRLGARMPDKVNTNSSFGQEIIIPHVTHDDAGRYRCTARNSPDEGDSWETMMLTIESAPYWRQDIEPEDINTSEEEDAEFECIVDGQPAPAVSWTFNGLSLHESSPNDRRIVQGNKVTFLNVTKDDSQVLQCNASNVHGYILVNVFLHVKAEIASIVEAFEKKIKVSEDTKVILKCRAEGSPKPKIEWKRGRSKIPVVTANRFRIHSNGDLEISNVLLEDEDLYECIARNKFGSDSSEGHLSIRNKTYIIASPIENQVVNVSSAVQFLCSAETDRRELSSLTIKWLKDDQPLHLSHNVNTSPHLSNDGKTLIFSSVHVNDTAEYTCVADNKIDSDRHSVELIVKDRPSPPTDVRLTSCLTNSAEVSWTASVDNNAHVGEYIVYYNASHEPYGVFREGAKTEKTSAKVSPLKPWTNYTFHVRAESEMGVSDPSGFTAVVCVTPQSIPYHNPSGVCTVNGKPGELVIVWETISRSDHNGMNFHYLVHYKLLPEDDDDDDYDRNNGSNVDYVQVNEWRQDRLIIRNQTTFGKFEISVSAVNSKGIAPDRTNERVIGHSSEGVPSVRPENFRIVKSSLNATSVEFEWDAIDRKSKLINGFFKGYQVRFWRNGIPEVVRSEDLLLETFPRHCSRAPRKIKDPALTKRHRRQRSPEQIILSTNRLWGGATINAAAVVLNGANAGHLSDVVVFETPEGVPDAVPSFFVSEKGSQHMKLEWSPPEETNGKLDHFIIGYKIKGSSVGYKMVISNPLDTSAKIHNLSPEMVYSIFIEPHTLTGGGVKRYVEETTLPLSPPDKPHITVHEKGHDFFVITWLPPGGRPSKNPGSMFMVEYRLQGSNAWNQSDIEKKKDWMNITGLVSGQTYDVVVVAMNGYETNREDLEDDEDVQDDRDGQDDRDVTRSDLVTVFLGPDQQPVVHMSSMFNWFILLILAILLVFIILCLLCFIRQRRQGKYPVYEKEKLHGYNADNIHEEPKFGEYTKDPVTTLVPTSYESIDSIEKPLASDTNSLAEYEETDPTKFNEDGSFIGQYGGEKKPKENDHNIPFATIV